MKHEYAALIPAATDSKRTKFWSWTLTILGCAAIFIAGLKVGQTKEGLSDEIAVGPPPVTGGAESFHTAFSGESFNSAIDSSDVDKDETPTFGDLNEDEPEDVAWDHGGAVAGDTFMINPDTKVDVFQAQKLEDLKWALEDVDTVAGTPLTGPCKESVNAVGIACVNFFHCCGNENMQALCSLHFTQRGVAPHPENPLKKKAAMQTENCQGTQAYDWNQLFCNTKVAMNIPTKLDWTIWILNKMISHIQYAGKTLLKLTGADAIFDTIKGVVEKADSADGGGFGLAITGFFKNLDKLEIWKSMILRRVAITGGHGKDGMGKLRVNKGDIVHMYANMNMLINPDRKFPWLCRIAAAWRFGFVEGLLGVAKKAAPAILLLRDFMNKEVKPGTRLKAIFDPETGLFGSVARVLKTVEDFFKSKLGDTEMAKIVSAGFQKFEGMLENITEDPEIKKALAAVDKADFANIKANPGPMTENLVEAIGNKVFQVPTYLIMRQCVSKAIESPKDSGWMEQKWGSKIMQGMTSLTGVFGGLAKAETAEERRRELELLLDEVKAEENDNFIPGQNSEEEAVGKYPDEEAVGAAFFDRPDIRWAMAHHYTAANHELHPELDSKWVSPFMEVHRDAAHNFFVTRGEDHPDAEPELFYEMNPQFRRMRR